MCTPSLNWIACILVQIMVGNHHFLSFCCHQKAKFWPKWPKSMSILETHPISVTPNLNWTAWIFCQIMFGNHHFHSFLATRWPKSVQHGQNANQFWTHPISAHTTFELDCVDILSETGWKPPFSVILWPLGGQNLSNIAKKQPNSEHSFNKCTRQVWIGLHK